VLAVSRRARYSVWSSAAKATVGENHYIRRVRLSLPANEIAEIDRTYGPEFIGDIEDRRGRLTRDGRLRLVYKEWEQADTGRIALRVVGHNFDFRAGARMGLPDGRWFCFPVHFPPDTVRSDRAIMSACTPNGQTVVRYRYRPRSSHGVHLVPDSLYWHLKRSTATIEVVVSPGVNLDNQLILVTAISAPELTGFFLRPGGGG
jgi:hypothetical protein